MSSPSVIAALCLQVLLYGGLVMLFFNPMAGVGMIVASGIIFLAARPRQ